MRRMICGVLVLLALFAAPHQSAAAGSWNATVSGGASVPTGDFGDKAKGYAQAGWSIGGSMDYMYTDQWAFGGDGSWNSNSSGNEGAVFSGSTLEKDKFSVWQLGAHAKYFFPMAAQAPVKWYGLMGASLYGFKNDQTWNTGGTTTESSSSDKRAGTKLGLGGTYWQNSQVGWDFGADYNLAFLDKDQSSSSSLSYLGLHAGVTFNIPQAK